MDAAGALADLTEISSQVEAAVVLDDAGAVVASTLDDADRSARLARAAVDLLGAADKRSESGGRALTQLEAALRDGSVFVAREQGRSIVATTSAEPTSGLVFYDLKTCLRALDDSKPASKTAAKQARPKRRPKPESSNDGDNGA
jgi:predicted regulator of Ras-like GTPase activity (Roadblock/LC7/MglB family)